MVSQLRQQQLSFHGTSRGGVANRPGRISKAPTAHNLPLLCAIGRRRVRGINEVKVIEAFSESRMRFAAGLPDSDDSDDGQPKQRQSYSQEKKLQAVSFLELTDVPGKKGGPDKTISLRLAASTIKVDKKQLRE